MGAFVEHAVASSHVLRARADLRPRRGRRTGAGSSCASSRRRRRRSALMQLGAAALVGARPLRRIAVEAAPRGWASPGAIGVGRRHVPARRRSAGACARAPVRRRGAPRHRAAGCSTSPRCSRPARASPTRRRCSARCARSATATSSRPSQALTAAKDRAPAEARLAIDERIALLYLAAYRWSEAIAHAEEHLFGAIPPSRRPTVRTCGRSLRRALGIAPPVWVELLGAYGRTGDLDQAGARCSRGSRTSARAAPTRRCGSIAGA